MLFFCKCMAQPPLSGCSPFCHLLKRCGGQIEKKKRKSALRHWEPLELNWLQRKKRGENAKQFSSLLWCSSSTPGPALVPSFRMRTLGMFSRLWLDCGGQFVFQMFFFGTAHRNVTFVFISVACSSLKGLGLAQTFSTRVKVTTMGNTRAKLIFFSAGRCLAQCLHCPGGRPSVSCKR